MMKSVFALSVLTLVGACALEPERLLVTEPRADSITRSTLNLMTLPPPQQRVAVAVYNYTDQTGQFRPTDGVQTLSRAVTQGGTSILVKALDDAGQGQWFTVIERERLDNLMRERNIIRETRQRYLGETEPPADALPPMLFAGVLLEGGVIGFDSNTVTGGAGARYLGVGVNTRYRQDTVTVYLRAVSVRTGEVLLTVTAKKVIASQAISANAFRFVSFRELLEADVGITTNEPDQLALRQAIEKAVHNLILEGSVRNLWTFRDQDAVAPLLARYQQERFEGLGAREIQALRDNAAPRRAAASVTRQASQAPIPAPAPAPSSTPAAEPAAEPAAPQPVALATATPVASPLTPSAEEMASNASEPAASSLAAPAPAPEVTEPASQTADAPPG